MFARTGIEFGIAILVSLFAFKVYLDSINPALSFHLVCRSAPIHLSQTTTSIGPFSKGLRTFLLVLYFIFYSSLVFYPHPIFYVFYLFLLHRARGETFVFASESRYRCAASHFTTV